MDGSSDRCTTFSSSSFDPFTKSRMATFACDICLKTFTRRNNLNRHLKLIHHVAISYAGSEKSFQCLEGCEISFRCNKDLINHLSEDHHMEMEREELTFSSIDDFYKFLNDIQESEYVEYIQATGKKVVLAHLTNEEGRYSPEESEVIYLICNRSGKPRTQSSDPPLRRTKSQGSAKINKSCTSQIKAKINKAKNTVNVQYWKTHYGHDYDLQHIRLSKMEKANIAHKLSTGVSMARILDEYRQHFDETKVKRIDLLRRRDLQNIKSSFNKHLQQEARHSEGDSEENFETLSQNSIRVLENKSYLLETIACELDKLNSNISEVDNNDILVHVAQMLKNFNLLIESGDIANLTEEKLDSSHLEIIESDTVSNRNKSEQIPFHFAKKKCDIKKIEICKIPIQQLSKIKQLMGRKVLLDHDYC